MEMQPAQWLFEEGMAYWDGFDFQNKDEERGQLMIEASASSGFPMAAAYCHFRGWNGLKKDNKKAFDMFVKIEKETKGYHWAQIMLGECYEYGHGVGKDDKKRYDYYTLSSEQGNSLAMCSLAYCYDFGEGTDENITKAFEWYEKSANLGYCLSMSNLAVDYRDGTGVTKNVSKAREWFTKAAEQGDRLSQTPLEELMIEEETKGYHWAQMTLSESYSNGNDQDNKERFEYYVLLSEQGNSVAMFRLGYCYSKGIGTDKNKTKAFTWYEKSANLGCCHAMINVGRYYKNGLGGVTEDLNTAREWYTKAAAQGFTDAQTRLDKLNAQYKTRN